MTRTSRSQFSPRNPMPWITAGAATLLLAFSALTFNACSDSSDGGPGPGGGYDSLHIPRSILLDSGMVTFNGICSGCHNGGGVGSPGAVPPIGKSDFVMAWRLRPVRVLLMGIPNAIDTATTIMVNGLPYHDNMPAVASMEGEEWSNLKIAGVLTYVRALLNDSLSSNCNPDMLDEDGFATCTRTARPAAEVESDSVAVWEVKIIRDSLAGAGLLP